MSGNGRRWLQSTSAWGAWLAPLCAGLLGIAYQLPAQILVFDEWHTLVAALTLDYGEIYTSFGDHSSIPVALYLRAAARTVGIGTLSLRLPFAAAAVVGAAGAVWLTRRFVDRRTAVVLAWSLALSPLLVYHARFARQYAIALPFDLAAVLLFQRWWRHGDWRAGIAYAALVGWIGALTLSHLGFVLACLPIFAAASLRGRREPPARIALRFTGLGLLCLVALGVAQGPALWHDSATLAAKLDLPSQPLKTAGIVRLVAGSTHTGAAAAWLAVAAVGLGALFARRRDVAALLAALAAAQLLFVLLLDPRRLEEAQVFCRYVLPAIVVLHVFFAAGLVRLATWLVGARGARHAGLVAATACVAFALAVGPQQELLRAPSGWAPEALMLRLGFPGMDPARLVPEPSAFYRRLAAEPAGSVTVVEAPYTTYGLYSPFPYLQRRHRQHVHVAAETDACAPTNTRALPRDAALALPNVHHLADPERIDASGADYLVVHRDPASELSYWRPDLLERRGLVISGEGCVEYARQVWGAPVFEDERIAVFALPGVRRLPADAD